MHYGRMAKGGSGGSGFGFLVVVALLWAIFSPSKPATQAPPASHSAPTFAATPQLARSLPPAKSSTDYLSEATQALQLVHTGQYKSRDVHAYALYLLSQIPADAAESTQARQFERGIASAYSRGQSPVPSSNYPETTSGVEPNRSSQTGSYQSGNCAENGSCYGDISSATGRPKTTHVNGYYRRDGTYVRGHYRSR